jgi:hypothetical protein
VGVETTCWVATTTGVKVDDSRGVSVLDIVSRSNIRTTTGVGLFDPLVSISGFEEGYWDEQAFTRKRQRTEKIRIPLIIFIKGILPQLWSLT